MAQIHTQGHLSTLSTDLGAVKKPQFTVIIAATLDTVLVLFRVDPFYINKTSITLSSANTQPCIHIHTCRQRRAPARLPTLCERKSARVFEVCLIKHRVCSTTSGCHSLYSSLHPDTAIHASCQFFSLSLHLSCRSLHSHLTFSTISSYNSLSIPSPFSTFFPFWIVFIALTNHIVIAFDTNLIKIHG